MNLVALVESTDHVCCRYRLRAFEPVLRQAGHHFMYRRLPNGLWEHCAIGSNLAGAEAVIVQRKLLAGWQWRMLRRRDRLVIFDFDDAVFLRDSFSPRGSQCPRRKRRFRAAMQAADIVIAGNAWLANAARQAGARGDVRIIPTCVDPTLYTLPRTAARSSPVRLVWIGSASTMQGLERIRPWLSQLGAELPHVVLRVICDRRFDAGPLPIEYCPWTQAEEGRLVGEADIGISWIPDDDWSRGKCGLKVLQYMAAGLPVVANSVGVHPDMVRPGIHGFLADSKESWIAAIRTLARNVELRRDMGQAARQRVEASFSVESGGRLWLDLLGERSVYVRSAG